MSSTPRTPRTAGVWALMALLLFQGVSAIGPGLALVASPSGDILHMSVSNMHHSPFPDYLIPGLILLVVLGILPLVVLFGMWRQRSWAWYGSFTVGCGLIIWIAVEMVFVPFIVLQAVYGVTGVLIALATWLPSVRRYCRVRVPADA